MMFYLHPSDLAFLTLASAVSVIRLWLFVWPQSGPTIGSFRVHHYLVGLFLSLGGIGAHSIYLYSIGLGLFVDEIGFILISGKTHEDNYSFASLAGTLALVVVAFVSRSVWAAPFL